MAMAGLLVLKVSNRSFFIRGKSIDNNLYPSLVVLTTRAKHRRLRRSANCRENTLTCVLPRDPNGLLSCHACFNTGSCLRSWRYSARNRVLAAEPRESYTCQLSRLRRESHACGLKSSISRRLTLAGQFLTRDWKMWVVAVLIDTISKNMWTQTHVMHKSLPVVPRPPPPSNRGAFAYVVSPGGWALAYPGATPGHLTHVLSKYGWVYFTLEKTILENLTGELNICYLPAGRSV